MKVVVVIECESLRDRIKVARKNRGFNMAKAARLAGMTRSNWWQIEYGLNKSIKIETLTRIDSVLETRFSTEVLEFISH